LTRRCSAPFIPSILAAWWPVLIGTQVSWRNKWVTTSLMSLDVIRGKRQCICRTTISEGPVVDNEMSDYYIVGTRRQPGPVKVRGIEISEREGAQKPIYKEEYTLNRSKK
jgi:hypothetical protein